MTYREAQLKSGADYLRRLLAEAPTVAEAARRAGVNRTDVYRLCALHGVEIEKRRCKPPPQRCSRLGNSSRAYSSQ